MPESAAPIDGREEILGVGARLAPDDPAVPAELRDAMQRGPVVLFFLRAFT